MIIDRVRKLVGQKFGRLTFVSVIEVKSESNRKKCIVNFLCDCGTAREYSLSNAHKIFNGDSVSCGCVRKEKWRKSYYAWKKDFEQEYGK